MSPRRHHRHHLLCLLLACLATVGWHFDCPCPAPETERHVDCFDHEHPSEPCRPCSGHHAPQQCTADAATPASTPAMPAMAAVTVDLAPPPRQPLTATAGAAPPTVAALCSRAPQRAPPRSA